MFNLTKTGIATAICAVMAISALPTESRAGVMRITDKSSVSLASPTDQVHWRRYYHRHWGRWNYGGPRAYGYWPGTTAPLLTAPSVAADGMYCATPVKTCLLYEAGWLGTGCSCKIPGGLARGTVE